jgi:NAD(P)H-nitrite reductase large subunit
MTNSPIEINTIVIGAGPAGVEEFAENGVKFTDGKEAHFDVVILAAGYRPRVNIFLNETNVYDENGAPLSSGHEAAVPGLYFCGYYVSPSGMLRGDCNGSETHQRRDCQKIPKSIILVNS